jgi:hypothetical protein
MMEALLQVAREGQVAEGLSLGKLPLHIPEEQVMIPQYHHHKVILVAVQLHKEFQIKELVAQAEVLADLGLMQVLAAVPLAEQEHPMIYQEQPLFTQEAEAGAQWVPDLLQEPHTQVAAEAEMVDLIARVQLKEPTV